MSKISLRSVSQADTSFLFGMLKERTPDQVISFQMPEFVLKRYVKQRSPELHEIIESSNLSEFDCVKVKGQIIDLKRLAKSAKSRLQIDLKFIEESPMTPNDTADISFTEYGENITTKQ